MAISIWAAFNLVEKQQIKLHVKPRYETTNATEGARKTLMKDKDTFVRLICRKANTASALKSAPGPSCSAKTMLV